MTNWGKVWTFDDEAKLRDLVKIGGMTWAQIGKKMGRSGCSVQGRAHRRGIIKAPTKPYRKRGDGVIAKPLTERDEFILRTLVNNGEKWETIAWVLDTNLRQVYRLAKRRDLKKVNSRLKVKG